MASPDGKLLALSGLDEGKEVTWLPSYGPEMRGGTANCTVVIADKPIGSPLISSPHAAVVMNLPSLERFAPVLKKGGVLVVNSSMVPVKSERTDITSFRIRANDIALGLGNGRSANLVMLGAHLGLEAIVSQRFPGPCRQLWSNDLGQPIVAITRVSGSLT